MKNSISIGMAGAGRAAELHLNALKRYNGISIRLKTIVARRNEQLETVKRLFGFEKISFDFNDLLNDDEIDIIDICTPPYLHAEMIEKAILANKHVICEKPLTGYFGNHGEDYPIGINTSKKMMYFYLLESLRTLRQIINSSEKKFMYAENFIYAPAITKAAEIISKKGSRILFAKGEESLKGSSSPVAGEWDKTGGGTFVRTGIHPLSAILWLKQQEAIKRNVEIKVKSVLADMARITPGLSEYEHRHIAANPVDVEDFGTVILEFSDNTRAVVMATDTLLGGSKNYVELYCNDAAIYCNLTMSDLMSTYFLDHDNLDDVYLSEMLPAKLGWNKLFLEDEIIRGYVDEMRDFMEAVQFNRDPKSGFDLAYDAVRIIYAAYMSAEINGKVELGAI
ncbi:MAG: Gfo/Idh/MocA family oxidoreductase [Prevotellaceae bacterium]|jgi:predicted dehydrogenase|nr:Gfo/Idh/MocA family oxidoreductase [Prevotellaceae bacterium]